MSWLLSITETDPPIRVLIQRKGDALRVKYYQAADALDSKGFDFAAAKGDELELLDASAIASFTIRKLPGEVIVEYFARVGEDRLVVTRPDADALEYEDMRLFFGRSNRLIERVISAFDRRRDGGSTQIDFDLDGSEASVFFPNRLLGAGVTNTTPVVFTVDGETRSIERVLPAEDPELESLGFECLR